MEGAHHHDKGGRGSTATQPTHRELAPEHAAGKVPVPLGRECQWETTGQRLKLAVKLCVELFRLGAGHLQQHSHAVSTREGAN